MCYGLRSAALKLTFYGLVIGVWVTALVFIGIGSYLAADNPTTTYSAIFDDDDFNSEVWETGVYVTITLGCIIAGFGFAGFCGVWRRSTFLIFVFCVSLIVFICVEFAVIVMSGAFKDDVKDNVLDTMVNQLQNEYVDETSDDRLSKDWNKMQQDFKCCGSYYHPDWSVFKSDYFNNEGNKVPYTCCRGEMDEFETCLEEAEGNTDSIQYLHTKGCAWQMLIFVEDQMAMIIATLSITMAIQVAAVIVGCLLRDNYKHNPEK